jgi:predicted regulator of Ras-like GTPase activity (Roadblock/LC7/MglB family)
MLAAMDAAEAIADLTEISPQVRRVVVLGQDGSVAGTNAVPEEAARLADAARALVAAADELRPDVAQLEAATADGSVFVVRDGARLIAATTTPEPTVGLVFYDLKTCLRAVEPGDAAA